MQKNILSKVLLLAGIAVILTGCSAKESTQETAETKSAEREESSSDTVLGGNIGISFPSRDDKERRADAEEMKSILEEDGYQVEIAYAGEDGQKQAEQIEQMLEDKKNCLVIDAIDSSSLTKVLEKAGKQGVTVISYDSLISGSEDVSYYVGFDYEGIGKTVGSYLVDDKKLDSAKKDKNKYTIEFFMGDTNDYNSQLEMEGIMEVLQPYFDDKVLECRSLRISHADAGIARASEEIASVTCSNIMQANYLDNPVDIVCAVNDTMAGTVIKAMQEVAGFTEDWPLVTGCDGTVEAFERIKDGTQSMTVYTDGSALPGLCAKLISDEIQGKDLGDMDTVNNGSKDIPSIIGKTKAAYKDNYKQIMEDAGL